MGIRSFFSLPPEAVGFSKEGGVNFRALGLGSVLGSGLGSGLGSSLVSCRTEGRDRPPRSRPQLGQKRASSGSWEPHHLQNMKASYSVPLFLEGGNMLPGPPARRRAVPRAPVSS